MPEPSLQELQRWMQAGIRPTGNAPAALPGLLNPQRGAPGRERLAVYADGYVARVQQALAEVYEAVRHVVGPQAFTALSRAYAAAFPSHEYNLTFAGRHLPTFLADDPLTREWPFLPDLARLEWLVCQAFHAHAQPAMDAQALAPPPARAGQAAAPLDAWAKARLVFQPFVGLVASAWPVLDIWAARHQPVAEVDINVVNRPQWILVARHELQVRCELLEAAPFALLEALVGGRPLGEALEALAASEPQPPVMTWFAQWIGAGLLVRIDWPS